MVNVRRITVLYISFWQLLNSATTKTYWPTVIIANESFELSELILHITQKFITNATSTLVVVEKNSDPELRNKNLDLLENILRNTKEDIAIYSQIHTENIQPWEYYVFIVDSVDAFRIIYSMFPKTYHERHFYFLIILTKYILNFNESIKPIFTLCYQFNVIDVIIIVKHPTDGVCIYTYILYSKHSCRTVQPILYLKLNKDFKNLKTIFPEKLNNFFGCPLTVSGRKLGPFLDLVGDKTNPQPVGSWENLSGVEGLLIRELSSTLRFKLELLPFPEIRSYIENSTCYGSFLELQNGNADVAIGGFSGSDPGRWLFSQSHVYHSSPFVYVVRTRELSPMARLAKPFSHQLWMLLAGFLFLGFIFLLVLRFLKIETRQYILGDDNNSTLNFLAILLGYSMNQTPSPSRNFARFTLLLLLLLTLVIRSAYQGSLYDAIRRDGFVRIPSGYKEIVEWNYKILISPEINDLNVYPKNLTITVPVGGYLERIKILENIEGRYASAILRESFIDYMEKSNWKPNGLLLNNEVIIMYHFVMFFPKNSIYLATFNKKLRAFAFAGITNKLKYNLTSEAALRQIAKREPSKQALGIKRLRAMYDIYLCMKILAIIVFCLEKISIRYKRLQRIFQWIE